jgi:hypothetical protein
MLYCFKINHHVQLFTSIHKQKILKVMLKMKRFGDEKGKLR